MVLEDLVPDGIHQMGLAQAGITEQKKGIVGKGWIVGYCHGGSFGKTVGIAHYEIFKRIPGRKIGDERTGRNCPFFLFRRFGGKRGERILFGK